jgi:hypothetical protein
VINKAAIQNARVERRVGGPQSGERQNPIVLPGDGDKNCHYQRKCLTPALALECRRFHEMAITRAMRRTR